MVSIFMIKIHTMKNLFNKSGYVKLPQLGREAQHEQYAREHEGGSICPVCHDIHYMKRWHSAESDTLSKLKAMDGHHVRRELCPACKMIKNHTYEGELFIENLPADKSTELTNLIQHYTDREEAHDPQSRIIDVHHTENGYRITTTENQLVVKLAKKIRDTFRNVKIHISYGAEPQEVSRVHAVFEAA